MTPPTHQFTVALHLGAHKTASTHLQQSIRAVRPALAAAGVAFHGPRSLRRPEQNLLSRLGFPNHPAPAEAEPPDRIFARLRGDARRVVFSEENFAGHLYRDEGRIPLPLYPFAPDRVGHLAGTVGVPVDLALAVRHPADFLSSLYSQVLLSGQVMPPTAFIARNPLGQVDWADYVARLRAAPGVGTLTVWAYEDYRPHFGTICQALLGPAGAGVRPKKGKTMQRLSRDAVAAALTAPTAIGRRPFGRAQAEALPVGPGNPPFDLYDRDARGMAGALYARQLARIGAMEGVTLLPVGPDQPQRGDATA